MAEAKVKKLLDNLSGAEIRQLGSLLAKMGEGGDTILAHITPEEAAMLKANGGTGKPNPKTGLPAFNDGDTGGNEGGNNGSGGPGNGADGVGSGDGPGGSGDGQGQAGGDPGAVGGDAGPDASGGDGGGGSDLGAAPPPAAAPAAATAETARASAMAIPGAPTSSSLDRTTRRAGARNTRAAGLSTFRSDLLIGGVSGGSGLAIPR